MITLQVYSDCAFVTVIQVSEAIHVTRWALVFEGQAEYEYLSKAHR